ncbi:MAG: T9SS type A sorting domain-containing protein, partial [Bacteroidia bacterium]|nr:T9SS type A sorting domain-containing protein [Bacteroidia bacterium]
PIAGADSTSYVVTHSGNYSVVATDAFGCTSASITIPVTYSAINDIELLNNLVIYPNPTADGVMINGGDKIVGYTYTLSDNLGRVVQAGVIDQMETQLSLNELQTGFYFLTVSGKASHTYKIVKK